MDPQPIRMLLIQGSPEDAHRIRALLMDTVTPAAQSFELEWVDQLSAVRERLAANGYDAILLDPIQPCTDNQGEEQRNAFLWNVLESLPYPFYVVNAADRTIEMANSAAGLRDSRAGRVTCHALTHHSQVPCAGVEHVCPLEQVQQTKQSVIVEHVHHDQAGNTRYVEVHGYPIFDDAGQVVQMIVYSLDITERKQTEAALQQRNRDLQRLNQLGQELGISLDLTQVLTGVLRISREVVAAAGGAIWLWDEERPGWLVCRAADPEPVHPPSSLRLCPGEGIVGWVAQRGESAVVPCVTQDPRCIPAVDVYSSFQTHSILAVPLRVRDAIIGVLEVVNKSDGELDTHDCTLLETLASSAAIAIEHARLHAQAQQVAVATERSRLARDLHDAVTQTLFSASLIADVLPRLWERNPIEGQRHLEELRELTRGALAEMRTLLLELRPAALLETELGELLHQLAEAISSRTRIPVVVTVEGQCPLPPDMHIALYYIVQEALNNVAKHAGASRVTVSLRCLSPGPDPGRGGVRLCIRDDGRGFDPGQVPAGRLGLGIMHERAESIGATFQIESQIGQGTQVEVNWSSVRPAPNEEQP